MDLLKRREEVVAANQKAETSRGSGWHPGDPGAEARDHELPLSRRPVALQEDDYVHLVGPDVAAVKAALEKVVALCAADPEAFLGVAFTAKVARCARKALAQGDSLTLPTQEWNYALQGLHAVGLQVCLTNA